ncbi:MAG: radical SAM protein, partial [Sporomusa sp.]
KLSIMIISGLGGKAGLDRHARNTALAINAIRPNMLSALTLMLYRGSQLLDQFERGEFVPLSPPEIMDELYQLISDIELPPASHCLFRSNHISNHIALAATLPKDKDNLLTRIKLAQAELSKIVDWDPYNNVEF